MFDSPFLKFIFFGNYFYGFCVVALSMESSLQQKVPPNIPLFYLLEFLFTVYYYNLAFSKTDEPSNEDNLRAMWHFKHRKLFKIANTLLFLFCLLIVFYLVWPYRYNISKLHVSDFFLLSIFPLSALFYYGINRQNPKGFNLRKIGWLKPFIIGFTWAGVVGVLPQMLFALRHDREYTFNLMAALLFLKNFMFISVLSIMFDIKDYARDYNLQIKTFVVQFGLRKTLFFILIPVLTLGLVSFLGFAVIQRFHPLKILLNSLPFLLCLMIAYDLQSRKSILYYLLIIDGLMLVKALCGSLAMLYF